jgi:hypothetical protein
MAIVAEFISSIKKNKDCCPIVCYGKVEIAWKKSKAKRHIESIERNRFYRLKFG